MFLYKFFRSPSRNRARSASRKRSMSKSASGTLDDPTSLITPKRPGRPKKNLAQEWIHTPLRVEPSPLLVTPGSVGRRTPSRTSSTTTFERSIDCNHPVAPTRKPAKSFASPTSNLRLFVATAAFLAILLLVPFVFSNRPELAPFRHVISWYAHWIHLGVGNTLGLVNNTWASHLAPFIVRVTTSAHICKTTNFVKTNLSGIVCPKGSPQTPVNFFTILAKVFPEAAAWSIGGSLAELVPFILATAFVKSLEISKGNLSNQILAHLTKSRTNFALNSVYVLAAIPNPIIDAFGLFCGLMSVPTSLFIKSLLIGRVLIRSLFQASIVVLAFSKEILEPVVGLVRQLSPAVANFLVSEINAQRNYYQLPLSEVVGTTYSVRTALKLLHLAALVFFAVHSVLVMTKYRRPLF